MFHMYVLLVACIPLATASVYPTQPVQATVWSADQPMLVSWVEDWKYPILSEMGPVDITLWRDTDTFLIQLASGVDPTTKTHQVTVPGWTLKHGSMYTLRFTTSKPTGAVFYSADFAIIPANTTTGTGVVGVATQSGAGTGTGSSSGTATWMVSGSQTVTMASTTSSTTTSASGPFGSTTPSGVPPPSGTLLGGGPGAGKAGQRAASAGRRGVDVEKLKFRFVFVIWPVLMGITMAL